MLGTQTVSNILQILTTLQWAPLYINIRSLYIFKVWGYYQYKNIKKRKRKHSITTAFGWTRLMFYFFLNNSREKSRWKVSHPLFVPVSIPKGITINSFLCFPDKKVIHTQMNPFFICTKVIHSALHLPFNLQYCILEIISFQRIEIYLIFKIIA